MTVVNYPITTVPIVSAFFPEGKTITMTVRDFTGAIVPITSNVCSATVAAPTVYRWDLSNIITPPTEGNGLSAYLEMIDTDPTPYSPYRQVFRWGESLGYESALGYFPEGSNVTIKIFDEDGVELPTNSDVCTPLANDLRIQYWGFSNLVTYPDIGFKGHWTMSIDDDSYPDVSEDFKIGIQPFSYFRTVKALKILKSEQCLTEDDYINLKLRATFPVDNGNYFQQQSFSARIISKNGFIYELSDWDEQIDLSVVKIIKEIDLSTVSFLDGKIPLTIGEHILEVSYGDETIQNTFKMVPITTKRIRSQYLLGIEPEAQAKLTFQQDLRLITGVELLEISADSTVGVKDLVFNFDNQTLQWDNGIPIAISDDYDEYRLTDYLCEPGTLDGNYITIRVEDIDDLPSTTLTETVIVDIFRWSTEDYKRCISDAHDYVCNSEIWTQLYPDYYSWDKSENAIYMEAADMLPSSQSVSKFQRFELAVNNLIELTEVSTHPYGDINIPINMQWVETKSDGRVEVRGFSLQAGGQGMASYYAGKMDKTIYADFRKNQQNKVKNYWRCKGIAGIDDNKLRITCIDVIAKLALINIYIWAASGKDQGIASRSFSASGVSSSYATTSSAMYGVYSANINALEKTLGVGDVTADQKKNGLLGKLKTQIEGGSFSFKL